MKNKSYKIVSYHNIFIDSFNDGEGKNVNNYTLKRELKAETTRQAIEKYFSGCLFYEFDFMNSSIDEETKILHCSFLVNENNEEATKENKKLWKAGALELYANNVQIEVFELTQCEI
jgi:hypothetical protein